MRGKVRWSSLLSFIPVIAVMITIFLFSNQVGEDSSYVSTELKRTLDGVSFFEITFTIFPIRKVAHFTIYAILGVTFYLFLLTTDRKHLVMSSTALCMIYAFTDEIHQLFVQGRGSSIIDVGIDTCGAFTGTFICFLICLLVSKIWKKLKLNVRF